MQIKTLSNCTWKSLLFILFCGIEKTFFRKITLISVRTVGHFKSIYCNDCGQIFHDTQWQANSKCLFLSGMIRIWSLDGASVEGGRPADFIVVYLHVFITKSHKLGSAYQSTIDFHTFSCHWASFLKVLVGKFLGSI